MKITKKVWNEWKAKADEVNDFQSISHLDDLIYAYVEDIEMTDHYFGGLTNDERKYIHIRCDQLRLIHKSKTMGTERMLRVKKPTNWILSEPKKVPKRETHLGECRECKKYTVPKNALINFCPDCVYCNRCGEKNLTMGVCVYISGIYCENCIKDDDLNGTKWEQIY
jgi:hypothetical protein